MKTNINKPPGMPVPHSGPIGKPQGRHCRPPIAPKAVGARGHTNFRVDGKEPIINKPHAVHTGPIGKPQGRGV